MTTPERTVVFILSSSHSGSTLLSLLLGSHSQTASIGELHKMFYTEEPGTCALCLDRLTTCPLFHDVADQTPHDMYLALFERTGKNILIDNSKRLWWSEQHLNDDSFAKQYIHVLLVPRVVFF